MISNGDDPFNCQTKNLDYYFEENYRVNVANKTWREDTTARNYKNYYNANIRKKIGNKKLSNISYADLDDIIQSLAHTKGTSKNTLKKIVNPIFKQALKRGEINNNPAEHLDRIKTDKKERISKRTDESNLTIAKKLYIGIGKYKPKTTLKNELNAYLYLLLLSAHRYGELLKLTTEDLYLDKNKIISPSHITKTSEDYHFPIPSECIEYLKTVKSGLLFPNLRYSSVADYFKKLVNISKIEFYKDKTLTPHDTRSLMFNIMIKDCNIDSMLADYCLDHSQNQIVEHYLDFDYKDKIEPYDKYWELIRS
jgi:integrase